MRILLTTRGENLAADIDPHFGLAKNFILVDTDTMRFEVISANQNLLLSEDGGVQGAKDIIPFRPDVVLTGNCGPKAFRVLQSAGVRVIMGAQGKIKDVIRAYLTEKYQPS